MAPGLISVHSDTPGPQCPCWGELFLPWASWYLWEDRGEGGRESWTAGQREGPRQAASLGRRGSSVPAGAALCPAGRLRARLPGQQPRAGKMSGLSGQAGGGQSPHFVLLIPQTPVELWPSYLNLLGGWISPGPPAVCLEERVGDSVWPLLLEDYGRRSGVWIFRGGSPVGRQSAGSVGRVR